MLCAGEASAASAPCALSAAALSESATASLLLSLDPSGGLVDAEALLAARAVGTRISALTVVPEGAVAVSTIGLLSVASGRVIASLAAQVS